MSEKIKVLFVYHLVDFYPCTPSFVQKDLDLLQNHFDVKPFLFMFRRIFFLPFEIYHSDVIFIWFAGVNAFFTTLFAKIIRRPIVVVTSGYEVANEKEINYGFLQYPCFRWMIKFVLVRANKILAVSEFNKKEIEKYFEIRTAELIYNCVDTNYYVPKGSKENIVISVGLITNINIVRKGLEVFVRSAEKLPDVTFLMIGNKEKKAGEYLKSIAPSNVIFTGFISRKELLKLYQKAKVYCQLSYYESFGIAPAEAMSCECVPVVTNRGALPEVVGETGFYADYGNISMTVDAINLALHDDKKGPEARKRVNEYFSAEKRLKCLTEIINGVVT
jgi:glycosyltransferase involved in cell wall biosynthesis